MSKATRPRAGSEEPSATVKRTATRTQQPPANKPPSRPSIPPNLLNSSDPVVQFQNKEMSRLENEIARRDREIATLKQEISELRKRYVKETPASSTSATKKPSQRNYTFTY